MKIRRERVEHGRTTLARLKKQANIRKLRGQLTWNGDLDAMRRDS